MGRKRKLFSEAENKYLHDNYLLIPSAHIAKYLDRPLQTVKRQIRNLGLIVPLELAERFKATHRGINEASPVPKQYYEPKVKEKIKKGKNKKVVEGNFKSLPVDYSKKVLVKVDHKTWVYRDK